MSKYFYNNQTPIYRSPDLTKSITLDTSNNQLIIQNTTIPKTIIINSEEFSNGTQSLPYVQMYTKINAVEAAVYPPPNATTLQVQDTILLTNSGVTGPTGQIQMGASTFDISSSQNIVIDPSTNLIVDGTLDMSLNNITNVSDLVLRKNNMTINDTIEMKFKRDNDERAYVWYETNRTSPSRPECLRFGSGGGTTSWTIALRDPSGVPTNQVNQLSYGYNGWDPTSVVAVNYNDTSALGGQAITNLFRLQTGGTTSSQLLYTKDGKLSIGNSYTDVSNNGGFKLDVNGRTKLRNNLDVSGNVIIGGNLDMSLNNITRVNTIDALTSLTITDNTYTALLQNNELNISNDVGETTSLTNVELNIQDSTGNQSILNKTSLTFSDLASNSTSIKLQEIQSTPYIAIGDAVGSGSNTKITIDDGNKTIGLLTDNIVLNDNGSGLLLSNTAGGNSGQNLVITINGVQYKIALLAV